MPIKRTIVVLAGTASLAAGGAAYAASGHHAAHSASATASPAAAEQTSPDSENIQSGDQTTPDARAEVKSTAEQVSPDTDNVQSGDQSGPDNGTSSGNDGGAVGDQPAESGGGSEVAGNDGPGGHADEPANPNADHQFQGQE